MQIEACVGATSIGQLVPGVTGDGKLPPIIECCNTFISLTKLSAKPSNMSCLLTTKSTIYFFMNLKSYYDALTKSSKLVRSRVDKIITELNELLLDFFANVDQYQFELDKLTPNTPEWYEINHELTFAEGLAAGIVRCIEIIEGIK